jgi:hypothetical protein
VRWIDHQRLQKKGKRPISDFPFQLVSVRYVRLEPTYETKDRRLIIAATIALLA